MLNSRYFFCSSRARWTQVLAAALTACSLNFVPAQAAGGHWTVSAVEGAATMIVDGEEEYAARQGYPVMAGTTIATGDDGTVVLVRRGDSITVYANSEMTVPPAVGESEPGVLQGIGKLLFRMETRESRDFEVRTPFLAATIKGTVFTVVVEQTRATVSVTEGLVRVVPARGGRSEMVRPGWTATAEAGDALVELARKRKSLTGGLMETRESLFEGSQDRDPASGNPASGNPVSGDAATGDAASGDPARGKSHRGKDPSGKGRQQGNQDAQ